MRENRLGSASGGRYSRVTANGETDDDDYSDDADDEFDGEGANGRGAAARGSVEMSRTRS